MARNDKIFGKFSKNIREAWLVPQNYGTFNYVKFRIWLNNKYSEKACWDWEYFIFNMTVGITLVFSMSIFFYTVAFYFLYFHIDTVVSILIALTSPATFPSTLFHLFKGLIVLFSLFLLTYFSFQSYKHHKNIFNHTNKYLSEQLSREELANDVYKMLHHQ